MQAVKKNGKNMACSKEMSEENTKLLKEKRKCVKEVKFNLRKENAEY